VLQYPSKQEGGRRGGIAGDGGGEGIGGVSQLVEDMVGWTHFLNQGEGGGGKKTAGRDRARAPSYFIFS